MLTLFTPDGRPAGLVHASTLTAFRTALASACLLSRRNHVRTLTVFGSGSQAYWHVRLALLMRGRTIKHVHIINRRFSDSAGQILRQFTLVSAAAKEREGWSHTKFSILTPTFHDFERLQKEQIRSADVIYCCTPSRQDLFEASILTSHEGRKKGRLIVAVGSYTPDMRELPEGLLHLVTRSHDKNHRHYHRHADEGGVIVVDTLEGVLKEAGEVIEAKISPNQMVECVFFSLVLSLCCPFVCFPLAACGFLLIDALLLHSLGPFILWKVFYKQKYMNTQRQNIRANQLQ